VRVEEDQNDGKEQYSGQVEQVALGFFEVGV
jgi:hypothetical protein